jgi:predicted methyltransferase MtxX (methanogen marker protein 4)
MPAVADPKENLFHSSSERPLGMQRTTLILSTMYSGKYVGRMFEERGAAVEPAKFIFIEETAADRLVIILPNQVLPVIKSRAY